MRDMLASVYLKTGRWIYRLGINVAKELKWKSDDHEIGLAVNPGYNVADEIGRWKRLGKRDQSVVAAVFARQALERMQQAGVSAKGRRQGESELVVDDGVEKLDRLYMGGGQPCKYPTT